MLPSFVRSHRNHQEKLHLIYITNDADVASFVADNGADVIMVDLEVLGKDERQKGRDTWISSHTIADVERVVSAVGTDRVMVRTDPMHGGLKKQIDDCRSVGATIFMQPMYSSYRDICEYLDLIGPNCHLVPLAETTGAIDCFRDTCANPEITRIHIGLNDLQISSGTHFLFEPVVNGLMDRLSASALENDTAFGFGGIARIGEGIVPAELILAEHVRLLSSAVILSRTFRLGDGSDDEQERNTTFATAVADLKALEQEYGESDEDKLLSMLQETSAVVRAEVARRRRLKGQAHAPAS